ncbi:glycosyltransferase family 92 protein F55C10.4-like [Haliotis cracherodii]|uniref:glycosyltransferase family 92 protein F55C10.4-like n=1 Tax=Haliotis cracherodii TaxID=6455 RepID=UPI0039EA6D27
MATLLHKMVIALEIITFIIIILVALGNRYAFVQPYFKELSSTTIYANFKQSYLRKPYRAHQPRYEGFQKVDDNKTFVYAAYYDDRDEDAVVKVVVLTPRNISTVFKCVLQNQQGDHETTKGRLHYIYEPPQWRSAYRAGFVLCSLGKMTIQPEFVSLHVFDKVFLNNLTVRYPGPKNNITRCFNAFLFKYRNVAELAANIEISRLFGVDKFVFYNLSGSFNVSKLLKSYESEGVVELRTWNLPVPRPVIRYWGQIGVINDCVLSQVHTARYVMVMDFDEIVIPLKHKTLLEMADDLFLKSQNTSKPAGSLLFRNVFYPTFRNQTTAKYKMKQVAKKYKIAPLLYTLRSRTNSPKIRTKAMLNPDRVEDVFMHYVWNYKKGYVTNLVREDMAHIFHYRWSKDKYMSDFVTQDLTMLNFSTSISTAVKARFLKAGMVP